MSIIVCSINTTNVLGWVSRSCTLATGISIYLLNDCGGDTVGVSRRVHISVSIVVGVSSVWMTEEEELLVQVVFLVAGIYHIVLFLAVFLRIVMSAE